MVIFVNMSVITNNIIPQVIYLISNANNYVVILINMKGNTDKEIVLKSNSNKWFKEKLSRFKPIVFLKKRLALTIFSSLFIFSLIFGLWDISKYSLLDLQGKSHDEQITNEILQFLEDNISGKNFFSVYSWEVEKELVRNIPFVKSATVSKLPPNKLNILIELYEDRIVSLIDKDNCSLLSLEGVFLKELCSDSTDKGTCCKEESKKNNYIFFQSEEVGLSNVGNGKRALMVMETVKKAILLIESFDNDVSEIYINDGLIDLVDDKGRLYRFELSDNFDIQLARFYVTMQKVKEESIQYSIIDVRFERPVLRN